MYTSHTVKTKPNVNQLLKLSVAERQTWFRDNHDTIDFTSLKQSLAVRRRYALRNKDETLWSELVSLFTLAESWEPLN